MSTQTPRYRPFGSDPGWLAAYTVALTRSAIPDAQRMAALLKVTDGQPALLEAAMRRLENSSAHAGCPSEQALCLLDRTLGRLLDRTLGRARTDDVQPCRSPRQRAATSVG